MFMINLKLLKPRKTELNPETGEISLNKHVYTAGSVLLWGLLIEKKTLLIMHGYYIWWLCLCQQKFIGAWFLAILSAWVDVITGMKRCSFKYILLKLSVFIRVSVFNLDLKPWSYLSINHPSTGSHSVLTLRSAIHVPFIHPYIHLIDLYILIYMNYLRLYDAI